MRAEELVLSLALLLFVSISGNAHAQSLTASNLNRISFEQKLNARVSLDLPFRDETGRAVRLGDYFGTKPVVLVLGYYECPMLCNVTLNGMLEAMHDMKWTIGTEFDVVNVSINPRETAEVAAAKKHSYAKRYARSGAESGWHFLTGDEAATRQLADEVGFQFRYDPTIQQYAHPSGLVIVTPDGKVSKYLFGVRFSPGELYAGLEEASERKVSSPVQQFILLCFQYSPIKGKYGAAIMTTLRVSAVATLVGFGWVAFAANRKRKQRMNGDAESSGSGRLPSLPVKAASVPRVPSESSAPPQTRGKDAAVTGTQGCAPLQSGSHSHVEKTIRSRTA